MPCTAWGRFTFDKHFKPLLKECLCNKTLHEILSQIPQQKLEDLLVKFPMEAVEARRWEKIANELGNRTPLQVGSFLFFVFFLSATGNDFSRVLIQPSRPYSVGNLSSLQFESVLSQRYSAFMKPVYKCV